MYLSNPLLFICANLFLLKYSLFRKAGNYIITQNFGGEEGIRTPIDRLCRPTHNHSATSPYSHIHLSDPEYDSDIPYIIKCMEKMHIKACCVSEDLLSSKKTIDLSKKTELIFPFVGIHPSKADEKLEPILELIN